MKNHPKRHRHAPLFERLEGRSMLAADSSPLGLITMSAEGDSVDVCPAPAGCLVVPVSFDPTTTDETGGVTTLLFAVDPIAFLPWIEYAADGWNDTLVPLTFPIATDGFVAIDKFVGPVLYSFDPQASEDGSLWMDMAGLGATDKFVEPMMYSVVPQASADTAVLASAALVTASPTAAATTTVATVTAVPLAVTAAAVNTETPTALALPPPAAWAAYAASRPSAARQTSLAAEDLAEVDGRLPKDAFAKL
ncbi:MAG: hypothetical protein WCJ21_07310 [Planctomycetota bacterium]